jgi:hypothetical protein
MTGQTFILPSGGEKISPRPSNPERKYRHPERRAAMDWNLVIERNREALKRILAMLVAMAGLGNRQSAIVTRESKPAYVADGLALPDCQLPTADCRITLPRHLHRVILALLRPAESAARRLIIVMARGLVVTLPPNRPGTAKPAPIFLGKRGGTGILMPAGFRASGSSFSEVGAPSLPLLDPLRPPFRPRRPSANGIPRISFPGFTTPFPVPPLSLPAPDDPLDATRLALRLQALAAALDDLPGRARRFARWKARKEASRDAVGAQTKEADAAAAQNKNRTRRVWPLRPGRPPGQRPANRRSHEVHEILNDLHGLAFDVLEHPDTS